MMCAQSDIAATGRNVIAFELLVTSLCAVVIGMVSAKSPMLSAVFLAGSFVLWFSTRYHIVLFYGLFAWVSVVGYLMNSTPLKAYGALDFVDEILVVLMFMAVMTRLRGPHLSKPLALVVYFAFLFTVVAVVSAAVNASSFIGTINYVSSYLKPLILFVSAVALIDRKDHLNLAKAMLAMLFLHGCVAFVQFASFSSSKILVGPEITLWEDAAAGLMGEYGAHRLGHFSLMSFMVTASLWIFVRRTRFLILSLGCLTVFILTFTELDYLYLITFVISCAVLVRAKIRFPIRLAIPIVVMTIIFTVLLQPEQKMRYVHYFGDLKTLTGIGKVKALFLTGRILAEEPYRYLVGVGPSNLVGGIAAKARGKYYERYVGFRMVRIKSTLDYWWATFLSLLAETGLIGLMLYTACFLLILKRGMRLLLARNPPVSDLDKSMAFAFCHLTVFLAYVCLLSNFFEWTEVTFPYAVLAAYVWRSHDAYFLNHPAQVMATKGSR